MRFTKRKQMKEGYWKGFRKTKTKKRKKSTRE